MKKVVVATDRILTAAERRSFSRDYPGYRLSVWLRFPWLRWVVPIVSLLMAGISLIISIVRL